MSLEEQIISELVLKGKELYTAGLKEASGAAEQAGTQQEEVAKKSKLSASSMIRAAAAAGIVYKGYNMLKGSINTTVQLSKDTAAFTRVSGLSAKQSQAWVLVARERGLQTKTMATGMATLGRQLGALGGKPSKSAIAAFQQLGLSQQALAKMPMQQRMDAIANAFQKLPNGIDKAALSQRLFGRSGQQLLPIFAKGAKGMDDMLNQASKLVPANAASGKSALDLVQQQRELNMAMMGVQVAMGTALIPILKTAAQAIQPVAVWFGKLLKIFPPLGPMIVAVAAALAGLLVFDKIANAANGFSDAMKAVKDSQLAEKAAGVASSAATMAQAAAVRVAAAAQWLWNAAMDANPILLIVTALVALGAALVVAYLKVKWFHDLVNAAWEGIKTAVMAVINWIKDNWRLLAVIVATIMLGPLAGVAAAFFLLRGKVMAVLSAIKDGFSAVKNWVIGQVNGIIAFVGTLPKRIAGIVASIPGAVSRAASGMFNGIKSAISSAADFVIGKIQSIIRAITNVINQIKSLPGKIASPITSAASKVAGVGKSVLNKASFGLLGGQHGGIVPHRGALTLVGEAGPEILALPGGASVTPLPAAPGLTGGGRPIIVKTFLERRQIGEAVADYAGDLQAAR